VIYLIRKTKEETVQKGAERRRLQSRQAKQLLLYGLSQEYQLRKLPEMKKGTYGKPCFPEYPDIHFNYSHADAGILCGIAKKPIGVDIERLLDEKERIASYICHEKEHQLLMQAKENERGRILSRVWTGKESYLKCTGSGIREKLSDLDLSACLLHGGIFRKQYELHFFDGEDYTAAVCVQGEYPQDALELFKVGQDLLKQIQ
jgi:4'-phosphopantetheinyl transferase